YFPIITDLYRRTQPIIRYKLDDILVEGETCACGSHFQVIERIEGRADDIIKLRDDSGRLTDIFPDYLSRAIVTSSDLITDYMVSQTAENILEIFINNSTDEIRLAVRNNIISLLQKFNINSAIIQFNPSKLTEQGTKLRRIRNEYFKSMQDNRNG
ncbi:MAG: adenylate cyclase, partial [Bacteroidales bacterium]|nr:adenylate cyclase [Bacteroidales bacterium]